MRYALICVIPVALGLAMLADGDFNLEAAIFLATLFAIALVTFLVNPDRSAKLLASGNVTFGKIVEAEWVGNVEAELGWSLEYVFADSDGTLHTVRPDYINDDTKEFKVGDVLPVFYDSGNPSRNYLLLDPNRIVRSK